MNQTYTNKSVIRSQNFDLLISNSLVYHLSKNNSLSNRLVDFVLFCLDPSATCFPFYRQRYFSLEAGYCLTFWDFQAHMMLS